ncbi:MAG: hypothetical protein FJX72_01750 [Armatimonadetes bacterium]|nr:hypothetical protein [Armatimonadota bacterium]
MPATGVGSRSGPCVALSGHWGGYLAATQTPDGVIHLISSRLHYRFNLGWLKQGWSITAG